MFPPGGGTQERIGDGFPVGTVTGAGPKTLLAQTELEPSEIQDLGDIVPELLKIKDTAGVPLVFRVQIEFGDGEKTPEADSTAAMNALLENLKPGLKLS